MPFCLFRVRYALCVGLSLLYTLHADLASARNLAMRTLLVRRDWIRTGRLPIAPDASGEELKAARLQRYAELRWLRIDGTVLAF